VDAPDYVPAEYADEETQISGRPKPEYVADGLECCFTNRIQNKASCTVRLTMPDRGVDGQIPSAKFKFERWREDGPTWHIYGERWSLVGRGIESK